MSPTQTLRRVLMRACAGWPIGLLILASVGSLWGLTAELVNPLPNTIGEAGKAYIAALAQRGESVFPPADEPPLYPAVHGALLHATVGYIGRQVAASPFELLYIGRMISVAATLAAVGGFVTLARRSGASWPVVALGLLTLTGTYEMIRHGVSFRPDHWNLALSVGACLFCIWGHGKGIWLALVVVPSVAFFIKAPGVYVMLPVALACLLRHGVQAAAVYAVSSVATLFSAVWLVNTASGGAFESAMNSGASVPFSIRFPVAIVADSPGIWLPLFFPMLRLHEWVTRSPRQMPTTVMAAFWAVSMAVAFLTATRHGSSSYYFLEPATFGTLLLTETLGRRRAWVPAGREGVVVPAVLLIYVLGLLQMPAANRGLDRLVRGWPTEAIAERAERRETIETLAEEINRKSWVVYSDDPHLNFALDTPQVMYPILQKMLYDAGVIGDEQYIAAVENQRYDLLFMTGYTFAHQGVKAPTEALFDAVRTNYRLIGRENHYQVMAPAP